MLALCGLRPRIEQNDCDFVALRGHLPQSGSLLESTVAKCRLCSRMLKLCGLRPRIEQNDAGDFVVLRGHLPQAGPSSKVQSHNAAYVPERSHFFLKIQLRFVNQLFTYHSQMQASVVAVNN